MTTEAEPARDTRENPFFDRVMHLLSAELGDSFSGMKDAILTVGRTGLEAARKDLTRWTEMLAVGAITPQEYEWLVQSRVALIQVEGLKASGLALVRIDEFRHAVVRSVVGAALAAVGL